jgi:hypothetical protein
MPSFELPTCLHCERAPAANGLGLCPRCASIPNIRVLYVKRRNWTPQWEQHLRRLTRRAQQGLPLFDDEPAC